MPTTAIDLLQLARTFLAYDKGNKAEAVLQQYLSIYGESVPALDLLISICRRQGRLDELQGLQHRLENSLAHMDLSACNSLMHMAAHRQSEIAPAPCMILRNVLAQSDIDTLLDIAERRRSDFKYAGVSRNDTVLPQHRRSLRLTFPGLDETLAAYLNKPIRGNFERCCNDFAMPVFDINYIELKYCCYPHGSYFHLHRDHHPARAGANTPYEDRGRRISFAFYFHRTPKRFAGGDLLLHDSHELHDRYAKNGYLRIAPENNVLAIFPSHCFHRVTEVIETSGDVMNGRFAINGHLCAATERGAQSENNAA